MFVWAVFTADVHHNLLVQPSEHALERSDFRVSRRSFRFGRTKFSIERLHGLAMRPALPILLVAPLLCVYTKIDTQGRRRREDKPSTSKSSPSSDLMNPRRLELLLKIHFDDFTSKWDEYYGEQEWRENKLARLYSKVITCLQTLGILF